VVVLIAKTGIKVNSDFQHALHSVRAGLVSPWVRMFWKLPLSGLHEFDLARHQNGVLQHQEVQSRHLGFKGGRQWRYQVPVVLHRQFLTSCEMLACVASVLV